ncbi:hypothetical protein PP175_06680 [Aneurinibacillus sp. Ricciae_BoGa-3]|uniref:hypothetical protein n=1 Tax=Aneurinibacillus sp. Ricciae_BoGa-3 TaxID=3022697 RepID=UPI0023419B94|nr:hypothetical protein [Aneurinibacillus sp. Ricciae_BoGa-3]WCK55621.1 hypothetical protein PP175_06680 [Aneurinibacillus sp. Ricciae_BoGa-3]
MKKRNKLFTGLVATSVITGLFVTALTQASAQSTTPDSISVPSPSVTESANVSGHAQLDVAMTHDEANFWKNKMLELYDKAEANKNVSEVEKKQHRDRLLSRFQTNPDSSVDLLIPLPFQELTIGSTIVTTDADGNFTAKTHAGNQKRILQKNGAKSLEDNVNLKAGDNNLAITIKSTPTKMMDNMNKNMDIFSMAGMSNSSKTESMSGMDMSSNASMQQMAGTQHTATIHNLVGSTNNTSNKLHEFYATVGPYYPGELVGLNHGYMKILDYTNHVSCNKSSGDYGADFPWNSSDCEEAVAGGYDYYNDPYFLSGYSDGSFCVQEAMDTVDRINTANVYCDTYANNGSNKPSNDYYRGISTNHGYNCSSFPFLNHDERLNWNS